MALGTTDAANIQAGGGAHGRRADRPACSTIVGDDPVLWVNVKTLDPHDPDWADARWWRGTRRSSRPRPRYPNLQVYDWAAVVQDAWFQDDGIHYTSAGNAERARLIADALLAAYPA